MGFFDIFRRGRKDGVSSSLDLWREIYGGHAAKSGVVVTWQTALTVVTALACIRVRANGMAQVPLKIFRQTDGGRNREAAVDHPLYYPLHRRPNDWQTSFEFRQTLEFHRQLMGNAYVFMNRVGNGRIAELLPLDPCKVAVRRAKDYSLSYEVVAEDGTKQVFPAESIWHLRGPSWNGWTGLEVIKLAREALGLSLATEESQARLHKNGAQTSGLVSVDGPLGPQQYEDLAAWVKKQIAGDGRHSPLILDRAAKFTQMAMTGVDAQHIETRRHQREEICLALGVYPQVLGISEQAPTYASAEQFFGAHVINTLGPEYEAWEQSADVNLLTEEDRRRGLYVKFIVNGLLRGSMKDRADYYTKMANVRALNPNEIRALEEMNAYEGGDAYLVPLNMTNPANPDDGASDAAS